MIAYLHYGVYIFQSIHSSNQDYLQLLAQGQTQGSTLQQHTNKTLTTSPFNNTCKEDEVSPEVEARGGCMTQMSATLAGT
jgi:hypothetical protein